MEIKQQKFSRDLYKKLNKVIDAEIANAETIGLNMQETMKSVNGNIRNLLVMYSSSYEMFIDYLIEKQKNAVKKETKNEPTKAN